jgi:arylsulfatase A-like enzyme
MAKLPLQPEQHCDGHSLMPLLKGQPATPRPLFWHYPHYSNQGGRPSAAVRDGDWKLIRAFEGNLPELYDLSKDVSEKENLADREPDRLRELQTLLDGFLADTKAAMPKEDTESE